MAAVPPRPESPGLLEEFLVGEEHTFDSVQLGGATLWASVSDYLPPPLEVLRNPWIQWTVLLPRERDDRVASDKDIARPPWDRGAHGMTHMEWFGARPPSRCPRSGPAAGPALIDVGYGTNSTSTDVGELVISTVPPAAEVRRGCGTCGDRGRASEPVRACTA